MALRKVFETFDLAEMIMLLLDERSIIDAACANTALLQTVENSKALLRRLFLINEINEPKIWRYQLSGCIARVYNRFKDCGFQTYFTIWTPNPLLLTSTPQWRPSLRHTLKYLHARSQGGSSSPDNIAMIWQRNAHKALMLDGIDRLNLFTGDIFAAELDRSSVYGDMFLFREYAPIVTVIFRTTGYPPMRKVVVNAEGVRLRDVVQMLKYKCPPKYKGCGWDVQISIDECGAIFPTEKQTDEVEAGLWDVPAAPE